MVGSSPVTARISAMTALRTVAVGITAEAATSAPIPTAKTAAMTRLSRLRPVAEDTRDSGQRMRDADYKGRGLMRNFSSPSVSLLGPIVDQAAAAWTPAATL